MSGERSPSRVLTSHGLRPKSSFGQNFLADESIAARIAELATTPPGGTAIEIGAGLGSLTRPLLARASRVVAIERDRDLVPILRETFADDIALCRLDVVEADAKRFDYRGALDGTPAPRVVTGNLPYQLTGPLLELTVGLAPSIDRAVYMVQLEVGDRLAAKPDTSAYGALSVFSQAAFSIERAFVVRRGAFHPQPSVDSAVVVLASRRPPIAVETDVFRAVVRLAFAQRRKTLRNAWKGLPGVVDAAALRELATLSDIDLDARGETLDVHAFARMAEHVTRVSS